MNYDRRKFFTSIALGVGATAFPNFIEDFDQLDPVKANTEICLLYTSPSPRD